MRLLALDTTEQACSAALWIDGAVSERYRLAAREHSRLILPMIEDLLGEAGLALTQLDGLAFGRGPGSFTGVRIATAVAQGLGLAADLPLLPVSSLRALAQGVARTVGRTRVLAAFDARMQEVYWGAYEADAEGLMRPLGEERVGPPDAVTLPAGREDWVLAGSALEPYGEALCQRLSLSPQADATVHARDVATLGAADLAAGGGLPPEQAGPVYLRDQVAKKSVAP